MSFQTPFQSPLRLPGARKTEPRVQFAVLAWKLEADRLRVCLVTSRGTGRWILPKGWPMGRTTPDRAAAIEAWEEAGLTGSVSPHPVGLFSYSKRLGGSALPVIAVLYAMRVTAEADSWPEMHQRKRKWVSPRKAATKLDEPELAPLVRGFDPARWP